MIKGQGAQSRVSNRFESRHYAYDAEDGLDEMSSIDGAREIIYTSPKKIVNVTNSPDLGFMQSINPYQGCEHGCIYCYARNSHEYWGYNAGIDFERKILVKKNAAKLLVDFLQKPGYQVHPILLSGNTDCYQPLERKLETTRALIEILWNYLHPLEIITKNALIVRDLDFLSAMAKQKLVQVNISVTSLREDIRRKLEPRTSSVAAKAGAIQALSAQGVPVNVMMGPIIPGLTDHEIPKVIAWAKEHGASSVSKTLVRLNGVIGDLFEDWVREAFPNAASKVLSQTRAIHGGTLNESRFGVRMKGTGKEADAISQLWNIQVHRHFGESNSLPELDTSKFVKSSRGQLPLF